MGPLDGVEEKRGRFVAVDFAQGGERDRKRTRWTSFLRRLRVSHGDRRPRSRCFASMALLPENACDNGASLRPHSSARQRETMQKT